MSEKHLRRYKDTDFYLTQEGEVYRKYNYGFKKIKGCMERDEKNYKRIRVHIGNKKIQLSRMMWEAFKGEIPEGYDVGHINGCSLMNDLGNLCLIKHEKLHKLRKTNKNVHKVINLKTGQIYKGTRQAAAILKHSRHSINLICNGNQSERLNIKLAWWDDVNGKAFRGDYNKYYLKYMQEAW